MLSDLNAAARLFRRSPQFYGLVIVLLGVGIGANTAIYGLFDTLLRRPLPVREPDRLVILNKLSIENRIDESFSYPVYCDLKRSLDRFENLVGFYSAPANVEERGRAERVISELVTGDYFTTLGLAPHLGRLISPADDARPGAHPFAVLTHPYWQSRFGSDLSVVGRTLRVNGYPLTIIGVAPPGFQGLRPGQLASVIIPMAMQGEVNPGFKALNRRTTSWMKVFGRLRPQTSAAGAEAQASTVFQNLIRNDLRGANLPKEVLAEIFGEKIALTDGRRGYAPFGAAVARPLAVLFAGSGLLLLTLCANLTGLILARGQARAKEMAIRVALGASNLRLLAGWLAEVLLLGSAGGMLGLFLAMPIEQTLVSQVVASQSLPHSAPLTVDIRMALFAFGLSFAAVVVLSLVPAWRAMRIHPMDGLRRAVKQRPANETGHRLSLRFVNARGAAVISQVAIATLLLLVAALFVQTTRNLRQQRLGFRTENVTLFSLELSSHGYKGETALAVYEKILDALNASPGVEVASAALTDVLSGHSRKDSIDVPGSTQRDFPQSERNVVVNPVSPGYFSTLGIALRAGRDFAPSDRAAAPLVALVSNSFAKRFFPDAAVGRRFRWSGAGKPVEIIGVVEDVKQQSVRGEATPLVYVPMAQDPVADATIHLRSRMNSGAIAPLIREVVRQVDPMLAVFDLRTAEQQLDRALMQERLIASSATAFAAASLLLAILGLCGAISHSVARRTREFGIRLALGASSPALLRMILSQSLAMVVSGALLGVALAGALGHTAKSLLFAIEPGDPRSVIAVIALVSVAAIAATYAPARQASRTDPATALRHEE